MPTKTMAKTSTKTPTKATAKPIARTTTKTTVSPTRKFWFWVLLVLAFFGFIYLTRSILLPFVVGILTAYFLDPAADRLEKWGCSRTAATGIITISFFGAIILALVALTPTLLQQLGGLIGELPALYDTLRDIVFRQIKHLPFGLHLPDSAANGGLNDTVIQTLQGFFAQLLQSGLVLVNMVSLLVITPVVAFYLLRDWDVLVAHVDNLLPRKHQHIIEEQMHKIDLALAGFIRGQFNVMIILGLFYAIGLSIVGLKFSILVGLISGLLIIIPYIGAFIAAILSVSIAFVQFTEWWQIGSVIAIFTAGQILESYYLTPKLVGSRVGLHPAWIIFGMLAGGALFGFVGVVLAVPMTAVIGVLVRFAVERYRESEYYKEGR